MRIALALAALAFAPLSSLHAAFTDFSDYAQTTSFSAGETFDSGGLAFKALGAIPNSVRIYGTDQHSGFLYVGPGVEFLLPPGVQEVSFDYVDGAGLGLILNGVRPLSPGENGTPFHAGFSFLDGTSLASVDVMTLTTISERSREHGTVTFRGPIESLTIAGSELTIDNVSVIVPEPCAAALLLIGIAGMHGLHRRRGA